MANDTDMIILSGGEQYIRPDRHSGGGGDKKLPISYTEARDKMKKDIVRLKTHYNELPSNKKIESELIFCVRLYPGFLAKSYYPSSLFKDSWKWIKEVGSRKWVLKSANEDCNKISKLFFVRSSIKGLDFLNEELDRAEITLTDSWKKDIRKIHSLTFLKKEELIMGFGTEWEKGTIEIVMQPFGNKNKIAINKIKKFLLKKSITQDDIKIKTYENDITFISALARKSLLNEFEDFNLIRVVHPIKCHFPNVRISPTTFSAPKPPQKKDEPSITVGMFDGGVDKNNLLIKDFIEEKSMTEYNSVQEYIDHGTAVAGTILYGKLNNILEDEELSYPNVKVKSFRVLPNNPQDIDLYDVIDNIEEAVKNNKDIKIYNLSMGPVGPIIDDHISRFTYVLDYLAEKNNILFVIAVGNDGQKQEPLNRIQSPADMVNGIGVGAYTYNEDNFIQRAPYSCIGKGREGCKVKPDLSAFGGCMKHPFHVVSRNNKRALTAGTSFASPLVAKLGTELLHELNVDSLLIRALLLHNVHHPKSSKKDVDIELGYGVLSNNIEEILFCNSKKVTTVYKGILQPSTYAQIPILIPKLDGYGKRSTVNISWTIVTLTKTSPLHVEDYTISSIVDTFYPNSDKFIFYSPNKKRTKAVDVLTEKNLVKELIAKGWSQGSSPVSDSSDIYKGEEELREEDFKWDTVVHKEVPKWNMSLKNPYLKIHGLGRINNIANIKYIIIVTFELKSKYSGNLYNEVVQEFNLLTPFRTRSRSEVTIEI